MHSAIVLAFVGALGVPDLRCGHLGWLSDDEVVATQPKPPASPPERIPEVPTRRIEPERTPGTPTRRIDPPAPAKPQQVIQLPEEIVVRALDAVRPSFLRCFERAKQLDPLMYNVKVTLHMDVDAAGAVIGASHDSERPRLGNCLMAVGRSIKFPAPGQPAVVDVPLMF